MSVLQQSSATKNKGGEGKSVEDVSSEVWRGRYWGIGGALGGKWTTRKPCRDKAASPFFICFTEEERPCWEKVFVQLLKGGRGTRNMEAWKGMNSFRRPQRTEAGICSDTAHDILIRLIKRFQRCSMCWQQQAETSLKHRNGYTYLENNRWVTRVLVLRPTWLLFVGLDNMRKVIQEF